MVKQRSSNVNKNGGFWVVWWCSVSTWTNVKKALHFVHCKILNCITTEMLQKFWSKIIQTVQIFYIFNTQSFGPLNLSSCYSSEYSFSASSQYFPQVAGQTILPCTKQLILTKDFIKCFLNFFDKIFYHEQQVLYYKTITHTSLLSVHKYRYTSLHVTWSAQEVSE